jgi:GNAT superfamily N-acetyltransferase
MTVDKVRTMRIRSGIERDSEWIVGLLTEEWGSTRIVTRGKVWEADKLPTLVALSGDDRVGLATYRIDGDSCEMVSLNSIRENIGVGTALIDEMKKISRNAGCRRLWLITTNDNLKAIGFYQRRGFELVAVHRNALDESRKLKPSIPLVGLDDIPLRDEIEMAFLL